MNRNDVDKKCEYYLCDRCYHPCEKCYTKHCEQCEFGYKNIVSRFKRKYSKEQLEEISKTCQYAKWALEEL